MPGGTPWAPSCRRDSASTTRAARSTRSTRCASTAWSSAARRRAGDCSAVTRGAAAESTTHESREPDHTAREPAPQPPRLLPQQCRAAVGLVDRRTDDPRPDLPRPARRPPDPLDAEHAGPRAADEGDPAEVQRRPPEDERGVDEVLQGEQHQPRLLVPAAAGAIPDLHLALLRPAALREEPAGRRPL